MKKYRVFDIIKSCYWPKKYENHRKTVFLIELFCASYNNPDRRVDEFEIIEVDEDDV